MTRLEVYKAILFNSIISYRSGTTGTLRGQVIGDGFGFFNGNLTYTITVKDLHRYAIDGCRPDQIIAVENWNVPNGLEERADDMARKFMASVFTDGESIRNAMSEKDFIKTVGGI